jgi:hypothetical protein
MDRKSFLPDVRVKSEAKGEVSARFSTFNVIDKDGDVTHPGAIQNGAPVVISAYMHSSWGNALPVGKGRIRTTKSEAICDMQFFMDTTHGRDTFLTIQELAKDGLGEWSYGFDTLESEPGTHEGKSVNFLKKLKVFEVSPVLVGAGNNTRTLSAKSAHDTYTERVVPVTTSAIRPHETGTTAKAWDGTAVLAALADNSSVDDLRSVHAWVDPTADPELKSSYRFAHHHGVKGEANLRACLTGIALLNGARGDCGLDEENRKGVYAHLAQHLEDAGREVPELRDGNSGALKFLDDAASVLAMVAGLNERASEVMALRAKKGKGLSSASADILEWTYDEMRKLKSLIDTPQEDASREMARYIQTLRKIED